jgi:hypothetical protein
MRRRFDLAWPRMENIMFDERENKADRGSPMRLETEI